MEEQVTRAKKEAKLKATEWAMTSEGAADSQLFTTARQHQEMAKKLHQQVVQKENEVTQKLQRQCLLQEEQDRLHETVQEFQGNIERLESKRVEITNKKQEEESKPLDLDQLQLEHQRLTEACDAKFDELQRLRHEVHLQGASKSSGSVSDAMVSARLFGCKGPLKEDAASSGEAARLLWRLKCATDAGLSLIAALQAEDMDSDGFVTAPELTRVFARARVPGITQEAIQRLFSALDEGVAVDGKLSVLDLALSLPCIPQPQSALPEADLHQAIEDVVWMCRRHGKSEQEFKSQLRAALTSGRDLTVEGAQLCSQLGVDGPAQAAFGEGLDLRRGNLVLMLPSWRSMSLRMGAALVWRFLRDLNWNPAAATRLQGTETMTLGNFVQLADELGDQWAQEDLEDLALLCCVPGHGPPIVDIARFREALTHGLTYEKAFPDLADVFPDGGVLPSLQSQAVEQPPVARYAAPAVTQPSSRAVGLAAPSMSHTARSRESDSYGEEDFNEMSASAESSA